ncbi:ribonuclease E/G [Brevundimonas faecalis]|uniref:Ribonuclease G/E n=1 Tax=Brevundimonas faecalis TaxID=947378 RepID=A0ABV2R8S5_9CAUL
MADVEVFLDDTPGETRGVVARDGRFHHLIIQRESDRPGDRLGARSVGRVARVEPGLRGAFIDMGVGEPFGFLPLGANEKPGQGAKIEVETVAEPRERKGPVLRRIGEASGEPRLLQPGPDVSSILADLAPGVVIQTGAVAVQAALEAEEEALSLHVSEPSVGLDLMIQRTRALIAVDIDHAPAPGRDSRKARETVNREGLAQAARMLTLKGWGGLVIVDLAGVGLHGETVMKTVRAAFAAEPQTAFGPFSRFGLAQLSLPWRRTPLDDRLLDAAGRRTLETRAIDVTRRLRLALLTDMASPRIIARCGEGEAALAAPLVERLGPRAAVVGDSALLPGEVRI